MEKLFGVIGIVVLALGVIFLLSLLLAWPVQILWNWLMPVIFALPAITFWQSWGILLLSRLLTKGGSPVNQKKEENSVENIYNL